MDNKLILNNNGWKIRNREGFVAFAGISTMGIKTLHKITFGDGTFIKASTNHVFFTPNGTEIQVNKIAKNDVLLGIENKVVDSIEVSCEEQTYDIIEVKDHTFFANGLLCHNCEFLSSDQQLIDSLYLAGLTTRLEGIRPIFNIHGVEFYERIKPTGTYLVGVDPSSGNGEDYSVINIFEFPSLIQVGEYRKNTMSTSKLYGVLKNIIRYLEDNCETVFFSIENNGVGNGLISLYESDDEPVVSAEFISETGKDKLGFTTTAKTKMRHCVSFKELVEKGHMTINSWHTLTEMKSYVRHAGAYAAQLGATDDSISSILIIIRILEEIATYEMTAYEKLYSANVDDWNEDDWDGYEGGYDDPESDDSLPMLF